MWFLGVLGVAFLGGAAVAEDWPQFQFDARHSGDAPGHVVTPDGLGLVGAVALTDAVFAAPAVRDGLVYVLDGAGVLSCLDALSLELKWRFVSEGGALNCNNVSSPAVAGDWVHFGTTAGFYYVLDRLTGEVVKRLDCGEPVLSAPVVGTERVYLVTLGAQVYALTFQGEVQWQWDFVKEEIGFQGDRWSGAEWAAFRGERVTWRDHFVCSRDLCLL